MAHGSKYRSDLRSTYKPVLVAGYTCDAANTVSGATVVGSEIDTQTTTTSGSQYERMEACCLELAARSTLTASATATFDLLLEHADEDPASLGTPGTFAAVVQADLLDSAHGADALPGAAALTITDSGSGGQNDGSFRFSYEASRLKRFLRWSVTCTLSTPGADQAVVHATNVYAGRFNPAGEAIG